ncbi:hypothetical protein SESBI_16230 [Sesbania bispinosa]|nr:hypothetical protein SESBI_16230 [Sesbania bispinosa]
MGRDREKWCDYHRIKGHDTDSYWTLKAHIDKLIKEGYNQKPVDTKRQCRPRYFFRSSDQSPDRDWEIPSEEVGGTISTIVGGFVGGGVSGSSRRR